jgi:hypothetical protein
MHYQNENISSAIIGIDPGEGGGIAVIGGRLGKSPSLWKMPDTMADIYGLLVNIYANCPDGALCILEDVGKGVPGQSSRATATFARHNGHLEMALFALGIPTIKVTPQKWQKFYSNNIGTSRGLTKTVWKNKLKGLAQQMFPNSNITLYTADALLIANYGLHNK